MEGNPGKSYSSRKISSSVKIFISISILIGLLILGYFLSRESESLRRIITLLLAIVGVVALLLIGGAKAFKRIGNLSDLSATEKAYAEDLNKLIAPIFKDLSSGPSPAGNALVILGYILKWLFFWVFAGSVIIVLVRGTLLFDLAIILGLTITWCPWLDNLLLKKINYNLVFCLKMIVTVSVFSVAIITGP